jgi:hypothetical protein
MKDLFSTNNKMNKMNKINKKILNLLLIITLINLSLSSCEKMVTVDSPITSTNGASVYNEDVTAIAAITGVYTNMSKSTINTTNGWLANIFYTTGLTGDELMLFNSSDATFGPYFNNNLLANGFSTWSNVYKMIFVANSAIEGMSATSSLTPEIKNQLIGESRFIRAISYFYLVNLYGGIPLLTSTDYTVNRLLPRASTDAIYEQIIIDLKQAQNLLNNEYVDRDLINKSTSRIRPNKWAATALLARVFLYMGRYADAENQATAIIDNTSLYELVDLNSAFLIDNKEAIWQLQSTGIASSNSANSPEGKILKLPTTGPNQFLYPVYIRNELVSSFDDRDQRKKEWIGNVTVGSISYNYAYKYKIGRENVEPKEYSTVFRLAEQYLIRAEASIEQGKISEGIADLNIIRKRATDLTVPVEDQFPALSLSLSKEDALTAVQAERRHELFTEWGHRWLDLKRTNMVDVVLKVLKGSNWQTSDQLFPIPQIDIDKDPSLVGHQNPGYN